jgi:hypothetical protein
MELEIDPRRPGQQSIHGSRRQVGNVFARWRDTSQECGNHMRLNRVVLTGPLNRTSRIQCGIFPLPQALALLSLSRLRGRFLTLLYNHLFCCSFLRIGLDDEIFYQRS